MNLKKKCLKIDLKKKEKLVIANDKKKKKKFIINIKETFE
jgi:hypothetical protein